MSGNNVSWQSWPTAPAFATGTTAQQQQQQKEEEQQQQPLHFLHGLQTYNNFVSQARGPRSAFFPRPFRPTTTATSPPPPPLPDQPVLASDSVWDRHPAASFFYPAEPSLWPSASQPAPSEMHSTVANTSPTAMSTTATMWPSRQIGSGFSGSSGMEEIPRMTGSDLRGEPAPAFWPPASQYPRGVTTASLASPLRVFRDKAPDSRLAPSAMPMQGHGIPELHGQQTSATHTPEAVMSRRSRFLPADDNKGGSSRNGGPSSGRNAANKENMWPLSPWSSHVASSVLPPALGKDSRGRGSQTGGSLRDLDPNRMVGARGHYGQQQEHQGNRNLEQTTATPVSAKPAPLGALSIQSRDANGSHRDASQTTMPSVMAEVVASVEPLADKAADDVALLGSGCARCNGRDKGTNNGDRPAAVLTTAAAVAVDKGTQTGEEADKEAILISSTVTPLSPLVQPPALGFELPTTGYEFELNHDRNLRELQRQKQWARVQLQSCNENNRFQHTQTTACIAAVNGHILGGYHPASLRCYGTNPDIAGLRVTMTVYGAGASSNGANGGDIGDGNSPTLVLRHQIIVVHHVHQHPYYRHHNIHNVGHHGHSNAARPPASPASMTMAPAALAFSRDVSSNARTTLLAPSASSAHLVRSLAPPLPSHPRAYAAPAHAPFVPAQGRRYLFATTAIPLRGGAATRPGYRPVAAAEAVERLRRWGGRPDQGVFGNAWMVHLAVEPGHVQHVVDAKMMEQVARATAATHSAATKTDTTLPDVVATMRQVNERMQGLAQQEGTLSIMLSNHGTQKRIARQCPDLVAMWVLAQDNL